MFSFVMCALVAVAAVNGQQNTPEPLRATLNGSSVEVVSVATQTVGVADQQVTVDKATIGGVEAQETNALETPEGRQVKMRGSGQLEGRASKFCTGSSCNSTLTKVNVSRAYLGSAHGHVANPPKPVVPKKPCPLAMPLAPRLKLKKPQKPKPSCCCAAARKQRNQSAQQARKPRIQRRPRPANIPSIREEYKRSQGRVEAN
ncbi:hypothetical protein Pcinc_006723 [Petrolisthes cinctipes]|uniref:Uncharacterized protein n=1 Tax=Petrolisthes cinctipes TaxID=88211 RepID=A0AAE1KXK3_PETCI|nr:hypothetical protein Pcinc_006723 [Petrolisthes cinctipes]